MRLRLIIGLVTVACMGMTPVRPASAAFTDTEKAALLHARTAYMTTTEALMYYVAPLTSTYTTEDTRLGLARLALRILNGLDAANNGIGWLFGTNATDPPTTNLTRSDFVAKAWTALDSSATYLIRARGEITALQALDLHVVEYQDWLRQADAKLASALATFAKIDRSLAYADPNPAPPTASGVITIVGPHGDLVKAQAQAWQAGRYSIRSLTSFASAIEAGGAVTYAQIGQPYLALSGVVRLVNNARYIFGDVMYDDWLRSVSRFFAVLDALRMLTTMESGGAPGAYFSTIWPAPTGTPAFNAKIDAARTSLVDAWRHSDHAAWMAMLFPDCSLLKNPAGCGGR